ncbi:hypothetical protein MMC30_002553 [Trapelia coarctata]|nr:hypothetical protein [Trapelia coarctata]
MSNPSGSTSPSLIYTFLNGTSCPQSASRCGWVLPPNGRGTTNIIWSCGFALFICLWTILHLNLPAATDGWWCIFLRKARWLFLGLIAPEIVLLVACGQWTSAQRSVEDMRALGCKHWSMTHAFYADSGGFVLKPRESGSFPLTARQVWYLVDCGFMKVPNISKKDIEDKSKADKITKAIAVLQVGWLVMQCVARAIQRLAVTPLELLIIAIVPCSAATYFFWLHKPKDVNLPTVLEVDVSLADILLSARQTAINSLHGTPLDFVEGPEMYVLNMYTGSGKIWSWLGSRPPRPLTRIPNDRNPQFNAFYQRCLLAAVVASFSTLHFLGWDFDFPSRAEQILWWTSCAVAEGSLAVHGAVEVVSYLFDAGYRKRPYIQESKTTWPGNFLFLVPAGLYFSARLALLVGVGLSMRSLPRDAFVSVDWTAVLPHF